MNTDGSVGENKEDAGPHEFHVDLDRGFKNCEGVVPAHGPVEVPQDIHVEHERKDE